MAMVTQGPLKQVLFGFDLKNLLIRIDFDQPARLALAAFDELRIGFEEPTECVLRIDRPAQKNQAAEWIVHGAAETKEFRIEIGIDRVAEFAIPFNDLNVQVDQPIQFFVELRENKQSRDRAPREGNIQLQRPSADFERIMWDV
jgi:hypothetical protein